MPLSRENAVSGFCSFHISCNFSFKNYSCFQAVYEILCQQPNIDLLKFRIKSTSVVHVNLMILCTDLHYPRDLIALPLYVVMHTCEEQLKNTKLSRHSVKTNYRRCEISADLKASKFIMLEVHKNKMQLLNRTKFSKSKKVLSGRMLHSYHKALTIFLKVHISFLLLLSFSLPMEVCASNLHISYLNIREHLKSLCRDKTKQCINCI